MRIKPLLLVLAAGLLAASTVQADTDKLSSEEIKQQVIEKTTQELKKYTTPDAMRRFAGAELAELRKQGLISAGQVSALEEVMSSKNSIEATANLNSARTLVPKEPSVYGVMVDSLEDWLAGSSVSSGSTGEAQNSVSGDFTTIIGGAAFGTGVGALLGPGGALVGAVAGAYAGAVAVGEDIDNKASDGK